ncbi:DUF2255 family protein [Cellulomonas sp. 179-A 4D5 NHS]|uniref:DUF2255 family protein n=1 Tax=Cellulomonas sp. 179-A 4D5 NHS TaxID=3142378 RepID=UPI00399F0497
MSTWTAQTARALADPQEIQISTRRPDGTLRRPTTIWIVRDGDRVFVRSTNGRTAAWFRGATATGAGQIEARRVTHDVTFTEVSGGDLDLVDAAYRVKYGQYASIVDHLVSAEPRAATLEVHPA